MRPITGPNGDLLYGAEVLVREAGLSVKLAQPLYAGPTGDQQLPNPHVTANGVVDFWLEDSQRVSVMVKSNLHSDILVYLDAAPPPEETARTSSPLVIVGGQTPGNVLTAGDKAGEAVWGPPPTNSGITPQVTVISEAFSRSQDPVGWTFTQAATSIRSYSTDVPEGQSLVRSLYAEHTGNSGSLVVDSPGFTLLEPGYAALWIKSGVISTEKIVAVAIALGGTRTVVQELTVSRGWAFYRVPLPPGTYLSFTLEFTGAAVFSGTAGHRMWATGFRVSYGGLVPEHSHPGNGAGSVLLGTESSATGVGAVAVGAEAVASGTNAAAFGYQSQATGADALAVGSRAKALSEASVAVGSRATGSLANTGWTAVGRDTFVDAANGTAVGRGAQVLGSGGTAIGNLSYVGVNGTSAVALGNATQALAPGSAAIGNGAVVGASHTNSVAIGPGAATTAAGQIMLGAPAQESRAVVVPGRLLAVGSVNIGSDATSRLGFFGAEGTVKPVVSGADGGNLALRNLLGALAGLDLITNNTTP
ncbi:hypothetical protein [Streptomyces sp. NPDC018055]|uniref:hypothetical protein n=1 Tax=Streptomyces sp. NPDC018055 TaxID=3365038 RepID=UPI0037A1BA1A